MNIWGSAFHVENCRIFMKNWRCMPFIFRHQLWFFLIILPAIPHPHKTVAGWTHQKHAVCQNGSLQEGAVELPPYAEHLLHLREKNGVDTSADLHPCLCLPHSANKTKHKLNYTKTKENKIRTVPNITILLILQLSYVN